MSLSPNVIPILERDYRPREILSTTNFGHLITVYQRIIKQQILSGLQHPDSKLSVVKYFVFTVCEGLSIEHGIVSPTRPVAYGTVMTIHCDEGYELIVEEEANLICKGKSYDGPVPQCQLIRELYNAIILTCIHIYKPIESYGHIILTHRCICTFSQTHSDKC